MKSADSAQVTSRPAKRKGANHTVGCGPSLSRAKPGAALACPICAGPSANGSQQAAAGAVLEDALADGLPDGLADGLADGLPDGLADALADPLAEALADALADVLRLCERLCLWPFRGPCLG